jgi:hypothetical protein
MKAPVYLLGAVMLFAAACGDSRNDEPQLLFVQTSDGAVLTDSTLTLTGISPQTTWFTDRPYRAAGQIPTEEFLTLWDEGENSFADDPPNADFTCTVDGEVVNYVVELTMPELAGDELTYVVEGIGDINLPDPAETCSGTANLFIDDATCVCRGLNLLNPCWDRCGEAYLNCYFTLYNSPPLNSCQGFCGYPGAPECTQ